MQRQLVSVDLCLSSQAGHWCNHLTVVATLPRGRLSGSRLLSCNNSHACHHHHHHHHDDHHHHHFRQDRLMLHFNLCARSWILLTTNLPDDWHRDRSARNARAVSKCARCYCESLRLSRLMYLNPCKSTKIAFHLDVQSKSTKIAFHLDVQI